MPGERFQMPLPGTIDVEERRFLYVESRDGMSYKAVVEKLGRIIKRLHDEAAGPKEGGVIIEEVTLTSPAGEVFCAFSFRGDLGGWMRVFEEFERQFLARLAKIVDGRLVIFGGPSYSLTDCKRTNTDQ